MGEYTTIRGYGQLKLGTCEDWRYVRRDELELLAKHCDADSHEHSASSLRELEKSPDLFFRLPVPWEDDDKATVSGLVSKIGARNMFEHQKTHRTLFHVRDGQPLEFPHRHSVQSFSIGHTYNVNVYVPCPFMLPERRAAGDESPARVALADELARLCSERPAPMLFAVADKLTGTVFACPYCEAWARLDACDLARLDLTEIPDLAIRLAPAEAVAA